VTLVVGYATQDIGFLVADTLMSFPVKKYDPRVSKIEEFHVLKIQILNPDIAVAFAGDVETSLNLIKNLHKELSVDSKICVPQRLFDMYQELASKENGSWSVDCDFLVLMLTPQGKQLARVTKNEIAYVERAYIGDPIEYANLRNLIEPYCGPETRIVQNLDGTFSNASQVVTDSEKEFEQISVAMENLTHRRMSDIVGAVCGCVTRVVDARISAKLEYLQSLEVSYSREEGHAGFSLLASN
jgi:hypothetical protein